MPFSATHRTHNISKIQNLDPHQSRITFPSFAMRYPVTKQYGTGGILDQTVQVDIRLS